jgi:hypothetical protein
MAAVVAVAGVLPLAVLASTKTELLILLKLFPNLLFHGVVRNENQKQTIVFLEGTNLLPP